MDNMSGEISSEVKRLAEQAELKLIPQKSKIAYYKEYEKLLAWMTKKNYHTVDETLMLAYMNDVVVVICGIFGSCRRHEMCDLRMSDIKREGSVFIINIRPSKTEKGRKFAVVDSDIFYAKLFDQYISLRPDNISTGRVFLKYNNGKCIKQAVGINTFGKCPAIVARFLDLPDAVKYTGHAFRRSSATIMANSGMSVDELKRQVGWKSSTVASGYVEESSANKLCVSKRIAGAVSGTGVASTSSDIDRPVITENRKIECATSLLAKDNNFEYSGVRIFNNNNCTINVYLEKKQ
ncbi:phage integrase-related [Holotrichia oblita]|uniref:Phage integrase-related n=1 Tax=Holotrichia oblita TaxID=644536 RepID=A0ACB9TGX0_HOLOL|nr:phage integrase-related [Holotrichia oblita]